MVKPWVGPSQEAVDQVRTENDVERAIELLKSHPTSTKSNLPAAVADKPTSSPKTGTGGSSDVPRADTPDSSDQALGVLTGNTFDRPRPNWDALFPQHLKQKDSKSSGFDTPTTSEALVEEEDADKEPVATSMAEQESRAQQNPAKKQLDDIDESKVEMGSDGRNDSSTWDFRLPLLLPPATLQPGGIDGSTMFSVRDLVVAIQHGAHQDKVKTYIQYFEDSNPRSVRQHINDEIEGFPAMFYVVAANNDFIVRVFERYGGNMNAMYGNPPFPLLAFAIINSRNLEGDASACVATLLSLGADADVIPRVYHQILDQNPPNNTATEEESDGEWKDEKTLWCKPLHVRTVLAEALNITLRYHLHRSSTLAKPTERQKQVARSKNAIDLFAAPYFLIGQSAATELLTKHFLHYMLRNHQQPLVLVFAGPSGHGKTELARRLGSLLSLDLHVSDCTIVSREVELFGPRKPYVGAEEGSPLNNFLTAKNGHKCIVFLDEFEKTTSDIWNALLIPFDKGEYQDRRNLKMVDCSKTIWILATNALDKRIVDFCNSKEAVLDESTDVKRQDLLEELTSAMKEDFMAVFKPPLTGRISAFVPFLPFSQPERCVGAHKYLLELISEVRRPINMRPCPDERLLGKVRLNIRSDAGVCQILTKDYDPDLGIRSLKKAVRDRVASGLDFEYMATHNIIREDQPMEDYVVFASDGRIKVKRIMS